MDVYVGSIPFKWKEKDLEELFAPFGIVSSVKIVINKATRQNKGFGFVSIVDDFSAKKAINELDGVEIDGRKIIVNESMPKSDVIAIKKYNKSHKNTDSDLPKNMKPKKKLPPWQRNEY